MRIVCSSLQDSIGPSPDDLGERETVRGFTEWPTLDELKDSCLYLGSSTGLNHFLCSPSGHAKKPGDSCVDSVSFSEHYGVPFLLCTRSAVA